MQHVPEPPQPSPRCDLASLSLTFICFKNVFIDFIFQSSSRCTAILSRKYRDSSGHQHPARSGMFATLAEPTVTHHRHPESLAHVGVHSWCRTSCGFGQLCDGVGSSLGWQQSGFTPPPTPGNH